MARLRVIAGINLGDVFSFRERLTLGRRHNSPDGDHAYAHLSDPGVSREHLQIFEEGGRYYAVDRYSSNGSYIEGHRLKPNHPRRLPDKAEIKIGETVLLFDSERAVLEPDKVAESRPRPDRMLKGDVNPSMIIDAEAFLDKMQASGPGVEARNLARQIKAITQVSLALGGKTETSQLADTITRSLFNVFNNADNVFLFSYNEKTRAFTSITGSAEDSIAHEQVSTTIVRQVIDNRHALLIYDAVNDAAYENNESIHALQLRSVICAPLIFRHQILGLVYIDSRSDANRFSEEDLEILTGLSAQIAIAMKNTDLYRDIENLLEGFVSASVQVIESRDPVTAGHSFRVAYYAENLAQAVNKASRGSLRHVILADKQVRELRYASLLHDFGKVGVKESILTKENKLFQHELENIRMRFEYAKACRERHLYHQLLQSGETRNLDSRQMQEKLDALRNELKKEHDRLDMFFARIIQHNRPNLSAADMSSMLEDLYAETFQDLDLLEHRLLTDFEFTALKIPKGSLTDNERREIETHVTHTFNFLNLIPWTEDLKAIPDIAHAHHEKLDGSGYPKGIKARDIPLQSRIMTIADIYDALTAPDRPYKNSVTPDQALDMLTLEASAGKIDKELMKVFIESEAYRN